MKGNKAAKQAKQGNLKSGLKMKSRSISCSGKPENPRIQSEAFNPRHKLRTFLRRNPKPIKTFQ